MKKGIHIKLFELMEATEKLKIDYTFQFGNHHIIGGERSTVVEGKYHPGYLVIACDDKFLDQFIDNENSVLAMIAFPKVGINQVIDSYRAEHKGGHLHGI